MNTDAAALARRADFRTIGLVGLAHGTSHFFHMLLPPLFPLFVRDFGVSYAQLGLVVTVFFVVSAIGQALAGFLVDRVGARPVLFAAIACFAAAAVLGSAAQGLDGLVLAAVVAGLGNSPFHPVDFTILNRRVSSPRLGHAFSVHGISGNLGWAAAPLLQLAIVRATGSWRWALLACAAWALVVLALLLWQRHALDDGSPARPAGDAGAASDGTFSFLLLPSVWLCFLFFFFSTCALSAILSFASPALARMYAMPVETTAIVVTGFMVASAAGMMVGGFLSARSSRLEHVIGLCLAAAAVLLAAGGSGVLPGPMALAVTALSGFGVGLAGPSRDMLIRRASPPGATGRVYGTVYSGLDAGLAIAAPVFGAILDGGRPDGVFYGAALALALGIASAWLVGIGVALSARRVAA
jgi:MFS family permease